MVSLNLVRGGWNLAGIRNRISCFIILFLANFFTSKMFAWTIIKHQSKLGFVLFLTVVHVFTVSYLL